MDVAPDRFAIVPFDVGILHLRQYGLAGGWDEYRRAAAERRLPRPCVGYDYLAVQTAVPGSIPHADDGGRWILGLR